ncbi:MAG TPA: MASE3 domain-containing protein [Oscillospiraceae bacterium]|nr:MASE3 domain-containing protein [Oscillospiraceae bacterium]
MTKLSMESPYLKIIAAVLLAAALIGLSFRNYLLFHTVVEIFSILVSFGIAAIAMHTSRISYKNDHLLNFLGFIYFFVAVFDLMHTLAYQGMGVFAGDTANLATQLWIIPRFFEAFALLLSAALLSKALTTPKVLIPIALLAISLFVMVFTGYFPACFIPGVGLTTFKIVSEYLIVFIILLAIGFLIKNGRRLDRDLYQYLLLACLATVFAEISFTFYSSVYGLANMVGHLWKLLSYYFIYTVIIRKKLLGPYDTIKDLYQNMERKVATRTRELEAANLRLREGQRVLTQLNQKLSETNRLKSEFLATITHELRTPLTSIVAFCELLLDETAGPINEEQRENLLDIQIGSQQLMILISDILDMAKYEAGHLRLEPENLDLNDVLYIVRRTMVPVAAQQNITLEVQKAELPLVYADPERIRQMIINIISNAIKFTKEGGRVTVFTTAEDARAAIHIEDTGEGIAPELLPHIFEKFRQGDSSLKRRRNGTGLGLALVKTLAELQSGNVSVQSEIGIGTKFSIYIPFSRTDQGGDNDEQSY